MARIGLFGGTFDPIHRGHLAAARHLKKAFPLDSVYLVPSHVPPHKARKDLVPAAHRLAMIDIALAELDSEGLLCSDIELQRKGPSYTVDTVVGMRRLLAPEDDLFLIMGVDAFLELDAWRRWRDLLSAVNFIVMSRPGSFAGNEDSSDWAALAAYARKRLDGDYALKSDPWRLVHPRHPPIYLAMVPEWTVSSSQIRRRLRRGASIGELVPDAVAAYIASKGLYQ